MEEASHEGEDRERLCQAVSPSDVICGFPATVRCIICKKWFCDAHAEDELWHACVLSPDFGCRLPVVLARFSEGTTGKKSLLTVL